MSFGPEGKNKAITFSYDDGTTQDIRMIDLMNQYGLKGTFNINSGILNQKGILNWGGHKVAHYKLHAEDVRIVYEGHEIAAHTVTHPNLTECSAAEVIQEVETDRLRLSDLAGYEVVGMAYPNGGINNDDRVADIIKQNTGIQYSRTITSTGSFEPQNNLLRFNPTVWHLDFDKMMELGQKFIELETQTPMIFYIWGHSLEMDLSSEYWVRLEAFFKLISNKSDIFYGTNKEILL